MSVSSEQQPRAALDRVFPLYLVVFIGFVGYSLMITVFTPLLLRQDGGLLARGDSTSQRTVVLGVLLALYPLAQFTGAPIMGSLSDRFGWRSSAFSASIPSISSITSTWASRASPS